METKFQYTGVLDANCTSQKCKMPNLFQHQKLVCCVAAVEDNFEAIEEGVQSMENQIFVEVPIFHLFVLLEVRWALLLVCLLTKKVRQMKHQPLYLEARLEILENLLSFLDFLQRLFNLERKWRERVFSPQL